MPQRGTAAGCSAGLVLTATISLHLAPPDRAAGVFPHVEHWIENVAERSRGRMNADDIKGFVLSGLMNLWIILEDGKPLAMVLGETIQFPRLKEYRLVACVGEHKDKWLPLLADIEEWARSTGCTAISAVARKGWAKSLSNYTLTHVYLERAL